MTKSLTKAQLVTMIEALRAEVDTLRDQLSLATTKRSVPARPATPRAAYVMEPWQVARAEAMAAAKAMAMQFNRSIKVGVQS